MARLDLVDGDTDREPACEDEGHDGDSEPDVDPKTDQDGDGMRADDGGDERAKPLEPNAKS